MVSIECFEWNKGLNFELVIVVIDFIDIAGHVFVVKGLLYAVT
jgi:hypothetical protein